MAGAIKEGLICGECHAEFNSISVLLTHYQNAHSQSQEESKSIKGLIDKAKLKLLNKQEELLKTTPKYFDIYEDVSTGSSRSHFADFKNTRSARVEQLSSEASKLLIRLHKIISFEGEASKRRAFEQHVVEWMDAKHVPRCPDCAEGFNLLLRKHHCRLCGSILCDNCSLFISGELAASLTSQIGSHEAVPPQYQIRTCQYCFNLVNLKGTMIDSNPPINQLYDQLKQLMAQCEGLHAEYGVMISSVAGGDNLYSTEQVTTLRNSLIKHTEKVDLLSKRIILLGVAENESVSDCESKLRSRLRTATVNWIRDFLTGLSAVPEKEKHETFGDGWTPSIDYNPEMSESEEDVVGVQITRMRKWIAEAKRANRTDEVEMLQANLTDLLKFKR